jgi:hypothetical protein
MHGRLYDVASKLLMGNNRAAESLGELLAESDSSWTP